MNFADIENTWRSAHNRPSAAQIERDKKKFASELRRRHRGFVIFLTWIFAVLSLITAGLLYHAFRAGSKADDIDFSREWGVLLILALPWLAALLFAWQYRRLRSGPDRGESPISVTLRALLDENRLARTRLKAVAILHGVLLLVLPVVVFQLRAVGKAGDEILLPAFVGWPMIAVGIGIALWIYDRRTLQPRARHLETLLRSYEEEIAGSGKRCR
jgi:hypothetical protein